MVKRVDKMPAGANETFSPVSIWDRELEGSNASPYGLPLLFWIKTITKRTTE
jgi:hypothetical protein